MANASVRNAYLESLLAGQGALAAGNVSWLSAMRAAALERAHALTLPTTRDEAWRFTDLSPLYRMAFRPAACAEALAPATIAPFAIPEAPARLVFVDGHFAASLSSVLSGPVLVAPLSVALQSHAEALHTTMAQLATPDDDPFRAINTAYLQDGACVIAQREARLMGPIHLLFISTQSEVASHPRVLVVAQSGAALEFVEEYVSLSGSASAVTYCVNAVTEIAVAPNASVRHVKLQAEDAAAFHLSSIAARLARDARLASVSIACGARISRNNIEVVLDSGAQCELDGLTLIGGRQLADTHSFIDHAKPNGTSRQLHKCVVADSAHAVFNGRVLVRQDAQHTASAQQNRNLLLSGRAHVDTKPQLEILADDVKCSHGATVGQLEAEELFYLRSRGLDEQAARNLLTYGFAAEIVDRIDIASVVRRLRRRVLEQANLRIDP